MKIHHKIAYLTITHSKYHLLFLFLMKVDDIPLPSMGEGDGGFGILSGIGGSDAEDIPLPPSMLIPKASILKKPSSTVQP